MLLLLKGVCTVDDEPHGSITIIIGFYFGFAQPLSLDQRRASLSFMAQPGKGAV
jgi:hypothetical protein